jgi:hypothetical protein
MVSRNDNVTRISRPEYERDMTGSQNIRDLETHFLHQFDFEDRAIQAVDTSDYIERRFHAPYRADDLGSLGIYFIAEVGGDERFVLDCEYRLPASCVIADLRSVGSTVEARITKHRGPGSVSSSGTTVQSFDMLRRRINGC